jgi:hypothetical protein
LTEKNIAVIVSTGVERSQRRRIPVAEPGCTGYLDNLHRMRAFRLDIETTGRYRPVRSCRIFPRYLNIYLHASPH